MPHDERQSPMTYHSLPQTGFIRLKQILGNPKADPPIPAVIPVSKSTWWAGIKDGRFPNLRKLDDDTALALAGFETKETILESGDGSEGTILNRTIKFKFPDKKGNRDSMAKVTRT